MNGKTSLVLLEATVLLCLTIVLVALVGSVYYTSHLSGDRRDEQIAGCERANQQREYINQLLAHHPDIRILPINIPVCEDIIK